MKYAAEFLFVVAVLILFAVLAVAFQGMALHVLLDPEIPLLMKLFGFAVLQLIALGLGAAVVVSVTGRAREAL
jgi:hypothetical protein